MNRKGFLQSLVLLGISPFAFGTKRNNMKKGKSIRLLRHATLIIQINDLKLLIDPMLSPKDAMDPVRNCGNDTRFPMVELPVGKNELLDILSDIDAVFLTHLHRDHWDTVAQNLVDKNMTIFCQPNDLAEIKGQGFKKVIPVDSGLSWNGLSINRTSGKHGTGEIGRQMGKVSGFVLAHDNESIYIAGDTIWCDEVEKALKRYNPDVTILNTGGAKFLTGDPITMTPGDVIKVREHLPGTKIIAVHMDTVNHCFIRRTDLAEALSDYNPELKITIPADGEVVSL